MEITPLIEDGEALSSMPGLGASERSAGGRHIPSLAEQPLHWFAAYTAPRHEKAVLRHLDVRNVESFLPLYTSVRRWKNGCRVAVERPLFPGYVFVHIARRSSVKVLQVPGVV